MDNASAAPEAERLEWWDWSRLKPYPKNTRTHPPEQRKAIQESFRRFGWTYPILVQPEMGSDGEVGTIIAGHLRAEEGQAHGFPKAKVLVAENWSEAMVQAYVIADNQLPELAGWDDKLLRQELLSIKAANPSLLPALGFTDKALAKALGIKIAPETFQAFGEDLATAHQCPSCGYRWSGSSKPKAGAADEDEGDDE